MGFFMNPETIIQNRALLAVGMMPDVLIWRQHVGKYRPVSSPNAIVSIGQPGMADSLGVVAVTITPAMVGKTVGVAIAAEFKTQTGRQSADQKNWQAVFEKRAGIYRLIRSDDDMLEMVKNVKAGNW